MLRNYFLVAWRTLRRRWFYTALNSLGLAVGLLLTMLIGWYVWGELRVNTQLRHADRQYMLLSRWKDPNMGLEITTLGPLAKRLKEEYPALVANYYRWDGLTSVVSAGDKHFREGLQLGDSTLLAQYGFVVLFGDARTALQQPYSVVLTAEKARKYFGKTDVVGQRLRIQNFSGSVRDFTITAVLAALPENSVTRINAAINSELFIPTNTYTYFGRSDFDSWQNSILPSYLELKEGVSPAQLVKPIQQLIAQNTSPLVRQNLRVEPVALVDYYRQKDNALVQRMLLTISSVGLFILLMAIINFVNLSVSQAHTRLREVGVRKVLGSHRKQLAVQFMSESLILAGLGTLLALGTLPLAQPLFEQVVGKLLLPVRSLPVWAALVPVGLLVGVGLLAGTYPAVVLARQHMINALSGTLGTAQQTSWLRRAMVGFQFTVAVVVMIVTLLITQQIRLFFGRGLGYNHDYVVSAQVPRDWSAGGVQKMESIRNGFVGLPSVTQVSLSHEIPNGNNGGQPMVYQNGSDSTQAVAMQALVSDEQYLATYQIQLSAGRFFSGQPQDSLHVVLTEKAVRTLGYKRADVAIGQQLRTHGDPRLFTVVGVVRDFQFGSMHQAIQPMLFFSVKGVPLYRYLSFRVRPGNMTRSLAQLQQRWSALLPGNPFEYAFMDDTLRKLYQTELQMEKAGYAATSIALLVVLLGIIGMVSLSVTRRTKEIGIRKVLGASPVGIINLFVGEYGWVLLAANAVAGPLAYWLATKWVANYAYQIQVSWQPFVLVGVGVALLTSLVISLQSLRAALMNPVKALRAE